MSVAAPEPLTLPRRRRSPAEEAAKAPRLRPVPKPAAGDPADVREADPAAAALARLEVADLLARLPPLARDVLALRFGLGGGPALAHDAIGRRLGITAARSRAVLGRVVRRARERAGVGGG